MKNNKPLTLEQIKEEQQRLKEKETVLMLAKVEGAKAFREAKSLRAGQPTADSERIQFLRQLHSKTKIRKTKRGAVKVLARACPVLLALVISFGGLLYFSEDFRAGVIQIMINLTTR